MTPGSSPRTLQFDAQTLGGIVAAASAAGFPVAAHCHGTEGIAAACDAGVSTIEHCSWAGDGGWGADYQAPVAARLAQRGTHVSPTINRGWRRMIGKPSGERMHAALQAMQALDIPLIASTDAGIPGVYHADLAHALAVFAQIAGLRAEAALRCATSISAAGLGIGHETGSLTAGRAADILVVDGNPLEDINALTRPVGVWARGEPVLAP